MDEIIGPVRSPLTGSHQGYLVLALPRDLLGDGFKHNLRAAIEPVETGKGK